MKRLIAFIFGVTVGGILGSFFERFLFENIMLKYEKRFYYKDPYPKNRYGSYTYRTNSNEL